MNKIATDGGRALKGGDTAQTVGSAFFFLSSTCIKSVRVPHSHSEMCVCCQNAADWLAGDKVEPAHLHISMEVTRVKATYPDNLIDWCSFELFHLCTNHVDL